MQGKLLQSLLIRYSQSIESDQWTKTITVRVGTGKVVRDYTIHEHILRSHTFFGNALRHDWKEAQERIVKLPETHPDHFDLYVQWIYSHQLHFQPSPESGVIQSEIARLLRAYVLGQYLLDGDFRDAVIGDMIKRIRIARHSRPNLGKHLAWIYAQTEDNDPLRRLAVDTLADLELQTEMTDDETKDFPREALLHIIHAQKMTMLGHRRVREAPFWRGTCHYHAHEDGDCYEIKYALPSKGISKKYT